MTWAASGRTATVAVEVCTRPLASVSGTRWTRWTPLSYFSRLYARPLMTFEPGPGSKGNTLVPDLAASKGVPSDGGKTWTYKLRSGLKYQDGTAITWNGAEKFYEYDKWIRYLIASFLEPWGYTVNGDVRWAGEERGDVGVISVRRNNVRIAPIERRVG